MAGPTEVFALVKVGLGLEAGVGEGFRTPRQVLGL